MGVDEALLHSVATGSSPDTLRFYQWKEPTLSLGYFQSLSERHGHSASVACPVVRRSSGGGAILHDRELTYCLVMRVLDRYASQALYDAAHRSLLSVLTTGAMDAELFEGQPSPAKGAPFLCFQRRAQGDVIFHGTKICGSAQRREGCAVLQHGSLLLEKSACAPELPGIFDLSGRNWSSTEDLIAQWKTELQERLGRTIGECEDWDDAELMAAKRWKNDRFGDFGWVSRR